MNYFQIFIGAFIIGIGVFLINHGSGFLGGFLIGGGIFLIALGVFNK